MSRLSQIPRSGWGRIAPVLALVCLAALGAAQSSVTGWGRNANGETSVPSGLTDVVQIAAGEHHVLALKSDGTVVAWGLNAAGQATVPAGLTGVVKVAASGNHSLALKSNGTVVGWGQMAGQTIPPPSGLTGVVDIGAGRFHAGAVKSDGTFVGWGDNQYNQLNPPAGLNNAVKVAGGSGFTVVLKSDGTLAAWGRTEFGATEIPPGLTGVKEISANFGYIIVRKSDGTLLGIGTGFSGEATPPAGTGFIQISAGLEHAYGLKSDGSLLGWGRNGYGETTTPSGLTNVVQVAAGADFTVALRGGLVTTLDQSEVYAGASATGRVNLSTPAPAGGTVVTLTSNNSAATVPASVRVPAGATSASFTVGTPLFFGADKSAQVTAKVGTLVAPPVVLTIKGQSATASFNVESFVGGSTTNPTFTVTLPTPAPANVTFNLTSGNAALIPPATLIVRKGQTSGKVVMGHEMIAGDGSVRVTVRYNGPTVTYQSILVLAQRGTLTLEPATLQSGTSGVGRVKLTSPTREAVTVALARNNAAVTVPSSVTIPAGAREKTFAITTTAVDTAKDVQVKATTNGIANTALLRLLGIPEVASLTFPTSNFGRTRVVGTVRLLSPAPSGGAVVTLTSADSALLRVPASVRVPAGATTATFEAISSDTPVTDSSVVSAKGGATTKTANVTIKPLAATAFTLSFATVGGGTTLTGTVTLSAEVAAGTAVQIDSSDTSVATVPATVTILAGTRTATFTITSKAVTTAKTVKITVTKHASSLYRTLKVTP
ncbi:hypothetical protein EON81_14230 [bacterium]|nr:MAG: hypothetical protein EON81_14230 [bacterium]